MNIVKFKVWHKIEKRWLQPDEFFIGASSCVYRMEDSLDITDDILLLHSIGLSKNKNDEDIYEGDIIKHKNGYTYLISYCPINNWWYLVPLLGGLPLKGQDMRLHMAEIIGNVVSNPELIK